MSSAAQSPGRSDQAAYSPDRQGDADERLHELARRAADAEAELEFVRREHENERAIVQQLLGDAGTLQAQLDALQANPAIEVAISMQTRECYCRDPFRARVVSCLDLEILSNQCHCNMVPIL